MQADKRRTLLPRGSVVLLKNDKAPLMIYGRMMLKKGDTQAWDYVSVPYPEGLTFRHCLAQPDYKLCAVAGSS